MQFLFPGFLIALAALILPIIIHLFYFRRFKKVYFTNVKFLKEVKEETSNRRKLRNLMVLLSRLFALAFLVFAFAQPFVPQEDSEVKKGRKSVSIFIDNSFSMSALSQDVSLLDKAKKRAEQIIKAYSPEDDFQILTSDFEGRHQRLVGQEDALSMVDEIRVSPAVREVSKIHARQQQTLNSGKNDEQLSYIISDFQKNISDFKNITDSSASIEILPLQSVQEKNVSIDSAWFEAPVQMMNQTNTLLVKVKNHGDETSKSVRLSIKHNGQSRPVGTMDIPAKSSVIDTVPITILKTGWHKGELTITDYPIQFDDKFHFSFYVAEEVNVLVINDSSPNSYLNAAFRGIPYFKMTNQNSRSLEYSKFPNYKLIVLNDLKSVSSGLASELNQFVSNGGNVLVFPDAQANIDSYKNFLQTFPADTYQGFEKAKREVGKVNTSEFVFKEVFENRKANLKLPATEGNFKMSGFSTRGSEQLLTYRDGGSFMTKYRIGDGALFLSAAPLNTDYSNLVRNSEVFVPMLYKMAISASKERKIAYTIGRDETLETDALTNTAGKDLVYKLKGEKEEFIPGQRIISSKVFLTVGKELKEEGIYDLYLDAQNPSSTFAFNYDRKESDLEYLPSSELSEIVAQSAASIKILSEDDAKDFTAFIGERNQGVTFWRWCLFAVLAFLAIEGLLLRFWKV